jgi:hypothetical protein
MTKPAWFENRLSIGNLLTILTLIVGLTAGWFSMQAGVAANAKDIARLDRELNKLETANFRDREATRDVGERLARIEERLIVIADALATRNRN